MELVLLVTGKTKDDFLQKGIQHYIKKLNPFVKFDYKTLPSSKNKDPKAQLADDKARFEKFLQPNDYLIVLHESGEQFSSVAFSAKLQQIFNQAPKRIIFIAGSSYGIHEDIFERARMKLSLSSMTFTHDMVRLIFLEQLYRAFSIIHNQPYHH